MPAAHDQPTLEGMHKLLADDGAGAPSWFAPAIAAALVPVTRTAHLTYNLQCGDGLARTFKIVSFVNGDDPTGPQHDLPPLRSVNDIEQLTEEQTATYLNGYNVQRIPNTFAAQKKALRIEIGCTCFAG